jgi:DNA-binding NarL/FixJ family response regulator
MITSDQKSPANSLETTSLIAPLKAVGHFLVSNVALAVVAASNLDESQEKKCSSAEETQASVAVLGWFQLDGNRYAIIHSPDLANAEDFNPSLLLTERELQIATLIALGYANKQVAHHLRISEWTVSAHLRRIFIKLGVDSRAAMVYRCASLIQNCKS